jgi:hypothetical protein
MCDERSLRLDLSLNIRLCEFLRRLDEGDQKFSHGRYVIESRLIQKYGLQIVENTSQPLAIRARSQKLIGYGDIGTTDSRHEFNRFANSKNSPSMKSVHDHRLRCDPFGMSVIPNYYMQNSPWSAIFPHREQFIRAGKATGISCVAKRQGDTDVLYY